MFRTFDKKSKGSKQAKPLHQPGQKDFDDKLDPFAVDDNCEEKQSLQQAMDDFTEKPSTTQFQFSKFIDDL
jgi:hypothetical protein